MPNDKIIEKIRKLLALSDSPNQHEAAMAAERAHALLAEHNLSEADLKDNTSRIGIGSFVIMDDAEWRQHLGAAVGVMYFSQYGRGEGIHFYVGKPHNTEVACMMFEYLCNAVVRAADKAEVVASTEALADGYRDSFLLGAGLRLVRRIQKRVLDATAGTAKGSSGTTLPALVSEYRKAQDEIRQFINDQLGDEARQKKLDKPEFDNPLAVLDGIKAANDIGLDTQIDRNTADQLESK